MFILTRLMATLVARIGRVLDRLTTERGAYAREVALLHEHLVQVRKELADALANDAADAEKIRAAQDRVIELEAYAADAAARAEARETEAAALRERVAQGLADAKALEDLIAPLEQEVAPEPEPQPEPTPEEPAPEPEPAPVEEPAPIEEPAPTEEPQA